MQLKSQYNLKYIGDKLTILRYQVENYTKSGMFDEVKALEYFFAKVLNIAYDWNLINLNCIKINYPAIDLGDDNKKISVQVTASNENSKINDTLKMFKKHNFQEKYEKLYFFIIGKKNSKYNIEYPEGITTSLFNKNENIIDIPTFCYNLQDFLITNPSKISEIRRCIEDEFPETVSDFSDSKFDKLIELIYAIKDGNECDMKYKYYCKYLKLDDEITNLFNMLIYFDEKSYKYNDAIKEYEKYLNDFYSIDKTADYLQYDGKDDERDELYEKKGEENGIKVKIYHDDTHYEEKRYREACSYYEKIKNRIQECRIELIKKLEDFLDDKINNIENYKL